MPRTEEVNQQIREERKFQILVSAGKVFARKGLTDTRIADIAAEAGMSQGLIYRYFASKEEVFAVLLERTTAFMLELCQQAEAQPATALDKLGWLTRQILPFLYEQPEGALVIMHALMNEGVPASVRQAVKIYSDKLRAFVEQLIEQGQREGQIIAGSPAQLAILYLSTLQGLSASAGFLEEPISAFPDAETLIQMLRR